MSHEPTIYLIGNAHLDPAWLWRWQEGYGEVKSTFRSALDRLREFDEFVFTCSSACYYKWIEEDEPEMFEEIRERVREGRWVLVGGWWIQPDCNLPCGESFARQGLLGQRYFLSRFGRVAVTGYNVDSFGHHGNLPQLLALSGMRNYVFSRPGPHEKTLAASLFHWEGIDGSRVIACRIPGGYAAPDVDRLKQKLATVREQARAEDTDLPLFYGVGNHGGGPTIEQLDYLSGLRRDAGEHAPVFAGPDQFFDDVRAAAGELPVLRDDLQHHASGCYAAHAGMKRANRLTENALLSSERLASLAAVLTGSAYPGEPLERAWEGLLFNQFHDILCGCSIRPVHDDAALVFGESLAIAQREIARATQRITYRIDTLLGGDPRTAPHDIGAPIVVFNPLAWPVRVPVRVPILNRLRHGTRTDGPEPAFSAFGDDGESTPVQPIQCRHRLWDDVDGLYMAEVPAFGYATYFVRPAGPEQTSAELTLTTGEDVIDQPMCKVRYGAIAMENRYLRVEVDRISGALLALHDKPAGRQLIDGLAGRGLIMDDWHHDTWGHGINRYDQQVGQFGDAEVTVVEQGPVRCVVRSRTRCGDSLLTQDFTLYADARELRVEVTVDWRERHKLLKLAFPVAVADPTSFYEIPFGMIERPCNGTEEPGLNWCAIGGTQDGDACGLAVLNDGKYSFSATGGELRLTAARGALFADHGGIRRVDEEYEYLDQGVQSFTYALRPFTGGRPPAAVVRAALELNTGFETVCESYHDGALPRRAGHLQVSAENVIVTAFKRAEEDGYVLRAYEAEGRQTDATIDCPLLGTSLALTFAPCEIKTVRIGGDGAIRETNLLEMTTDEGE